MSDLTLLDLAERPHQMSDASLIAHAHVSAVKRSNQVRVFLALCDYCETHADVTGAELTAFMVQRREATDVNDVRPRLTEMSHAGWIQSWERRTCRVKGTSAHPYTPALPREALERIQVVGRKS